MIEESFVNGDSVIHCLDPRVKIIVAGVFSIIVAVSDRFGALISAIIFAMSIVLLARLPIKKVCTRLLIVNGFILLLWFFFPFTIKGKQLFTLGPLIATKEGIIYAILVTIKSNAIIVTIMALVATIPIFTMGSAMRHLYIPAKFVHLFFFTYRYIHVINMEYQRLMNAIKIRGFNPGTNMHTYKTYAYLVGMLFVKSYDRARRVRAAMLCRGFSGRFYDLSEFSFKTSDGVIMVLMLLAITGIGLLQWTRIIY